MIEIFRKTNIDFIGKRYIAFVISAILLIIGIISVVMITLGKANLGIDFAGGTLVSVKFDKDISIVDIRRLLFSAGLKDVDVQQIPLEKKALIKIKKGEIEIGKAIEKINEIFTAGLPDTKILIDRSEEVGPAVGKSLQRQALWAVFFAMIGITIYIWWRFEFRFGIAAAIATIHDVLAVFGICTILNKEFNLLIVTALLTLAGYSLSDTVVLFDRIRENLRFSKKESLVSIINRSINEVLSRTFITSTGVLLVLITLFFLGGEVIHDFSFALLIGIIVGTYSSIFLASPILVEWDIHSPNEESFYKLYKKK